jgi:hypothetical protein
MLLAAGCAPAYPETRCERAADLSDPAAWGIRDLPAVSPTPAHGDGFALDHSVAPEFGRSSRSGGAG